MFRTVLRRALLFLVVFLVTLGTTVFLTMRQDPVYKAKTTYITKLNSQITDEKNITTALDILNRQEVLLGTYSEVAMSQMIKQRAGERLGYTAGQVKDLAVSSKVVQGANILEITVEGNNAAQVQAFADMVGDEAMLYVNSLYAAYTLERLDPPALPTKPVSPNLPLNVVLGSAIGAFLGVGTLVLASWIRGELGAKPEAQTNERETEILLPVKLELASLQKECELIRDDLAAARTLIRNG
jgi:capsular polysaccharide biosynthesis protein